MRSDSDLKRELLRHALATLAYRGGKAVRNAPANFAEYSCNATSRTPGQILAHIGDLLDWAFRLLAGSRRGGTRGCRTGIRTSNGSFLG